MVTSHRVNIRNRDQQRENELIEAIGRDGYVDYADRVEDYIRLTKDHFTSHDMRFGAIMHYDEAAGVLEVEYSTMTPLEWTLRETAITFGYHARQQHGVMLMSLDFNEAQPVVNDEGDPIMVVLDFSELSPESVFTSLYGLFSNNAFASVPYATAEDGLHGWDDAEAFEEAIGRIADLQDLERRLSELQSGRIFTIKEVRDRLEDLQFYPTLNEYGWPEWSNAAVATALSVLEHERE